MDIKSMAKSKRSHTQHHQPRKPHKPKTPSSSSTKKDGKEKSKVTQPPPPSLPSNWDRYESEEEEEDIPIHSISDNLSKKGVDFDIIKPKSQGADFRDLIAQAHSYWPSFDDKLPESYQGAAPMLAARGEKVIVHDRDDDFLMEDEASGAPEASFLTLDLEDLAERLSKVDIAKRLFIEPDLLPPELHGQDAHDVNNQVPLRKPERRKIGTVNSFGELLSLYLEEERMAKTQDEVDTHNMMSSSNISSCHEEARADSDVTKSKFSNLGFPRASEIAQVDTAGRTNTNRKLHDVEQVVEATKQVTKRQSDDLDFLKETEMTQANHVTELDTTQSTRFEAGAAEAELDVLLGSYNEANFFDTSVNEPRTSATQAAPLQISPAQPPPFPVTTSLDDELDDLLAVTANQNDRDGLSLSQSSNIPSSSSQPIYKPKVMEDFDSWLNTL